MSVAEVIEPAERAPRGLTVSREAFEALTVQRGDLWHLRDDRRAFVRAWKASLETQLAGIAPFLPGEVRRVVDIGSGIGGIDVLLHRKYGCHVCLVDAKDEPFERHHRPFGSAKVALEFQRENGVSRVNHWTPSGHWLRTADLVISFCAWGFHFPPLAYLTAVKGMLGRTGTLICDIRRDKPEWLAEFSDTFDPLGRIERPERKFDTWAFACRQ